MQDLKDRLVAAYTALMQRIYGKRSRDQIALVLRLENTELLVDYLGQAGVAHLLVQMSVRMARVVRPHDPVQIAAPGLFAITLRTRSATEATRIAKRLQHSCQAAFSTGGMSVTPVLTGVLVQNMQERHVPTAALLNCGHAMLKHVRDDQLGQITLHAFSPEMAPAPMVASIAEAVDADQIEAYFQPQICCNTGRVEGFEALARWNHPQRGLLTPAAFMPGMSDEDHIALTRAMLRQALAALRKWETAGLSVPTVSVNLTQAELSDPGFADLVLWELDRQDISPPRLVLEILESIGPINSSALAQLNLDRLSKAGCQLDLDDFGTGFASFDSIRHFGVHRIKIDRSFVSNCHSDARQQRMILAILALAEKLGLATLAEGVENPEEHSFLAQIGCDQVQGYAIAPPLSLDRSVEFLAHYAQTRPEIPALLRRKAG